MTEKKYELNSYIKEFTANVVDSFEKEGKKFIVLNKTCFFPEAGGQPSDIGKIGEANIDYVFEENDIVYHSSDKLLEIGSQVECKINFEHRFQNMQIHTGEHILSGVIQKLYNIRNVGFHTGSDFNTIDLEKELSDEQVKLAELSANEAVWKNEKVKCYFPTKEELVNLKPRKMPVTDKPIKMVEVGTIDLCACCGTHVAHTAEVGIIKIIRHERYKGGTRITFLCGRQALKDYDNKNDVLKEATSLLSLKYDEILNGINKLKSELADEKAKYSELLSKFMLNESNVLYEKAKIVGKNRVVVEFENEISIRDIAKLSSNITEKANSISILFKIDFDSIKYVVSASVDSDFNCREFVNKLNKEFDGKGGGKPLFCQGSIKKSKKDFIIEWIFQNITY